MRYKVFYHHNYLGEYSLSIAESLGLIAQGFRLEPRKGDMRQQDEQARYSGQRYSRDRMATRPFA